MSPSNLWDWQAERFRITTFLMHGEEVSVELPSMWTEAVGAPPDAINSRPKDSFGQISGELEGKSLELVALGNRVDWHLRATPGSLDASSREMPLFPFDDEVVNAFAEIGRRWLSISPPVKRLAFGAILLRPVSDYTEGYKTLSKLIPDVQFRDDASDYFFQINRPIPTRVGIEGLNINRLTKWSVVRPEFFSVVLSTRSDSPVTNVSPGEPAVRVEIDVNTDSSYPNDLTRELIPTILDELIDLTKDIASEGTAS